MQTSPPLSARSAGLNAPTARALTEQENNRAIRAAGWWALVTGLFTLGGLLAQLSADFERSRSVLEHLTSSKSSLISGLVLPVLAVALVALILASGIGLLQGSVATLASRNTPFPVPKASASLQFRRLLRLRIVTGIWLVFFTVLFYLQSTPSSWTTEEWLSLRVFILQSISPWLFLANAITTLLSRKAMIQLNLGSIPERLGFEVVMPGATSQPLHVDAAQVAAIPLANQYPSGLQQNRAWGTTEMVGVLLTVQLLLTIIHLAFYYREDARQNLVSARHWIAVYDRFKSFNPPVSPSDSIYSYGPSMNVRFPNEGERQYSAWTGIILQATDHTQKLIAGGIGLWAICCISIRPIGRRLAMLLAYALIAALILELLAKTSFHFWFGVPAGSVSDSGRFSTRNQTYSLLPDAIFFSVPLLVLLRWQVVAAIFRKPRFAEST